VPTAIGFLLACHQIGARITIASLARLRGEHAVLREEALARLRALFERDGKSLH
jgi:hypothetical protein